MNEGLDVRQAVEAGKRYAAVQRVSPTARDCVDALGMESLQVEIAPGIWIPGALDEHGVPMPKGKWRILVALPHLSEEANVRRWFIAKELMEGRRRIQCEQSAEQDETTRHERWKDAAGLSFIGPEQYADGMKRRTGISPKPWVRRG